MDGSTFSSKLEGEKLMVKCPICGKDCKNAFYLGRHVSQKTDSEHVYDSNNSKPNLSESINDSSGAKNDVSPEEGSFSSSGSSQSVEWETEPDQEDDSEEWRDLKPEDSKESDLMSKGYSEIKKDFSEVR